MGKLPNLRVGLIGAGDLGAAMARAMIERGGLPPQNLRVHTRSGRSTKLADIAGIQFVPSAVDAARDADITLLAVPPDQATQVQLAGTDTLVLSVMAGVTMQRLAAIAGHGRVIRAMSSPAAARGLAFSVFVPSGQCSPGDIAIATALLESCGAYDTVPDEAQIDLFTALTGPVPGFVAGFAEMLVNWAEARGVSPETADRAVCQLMLSSGLTLANDGPTAAMRVQEMIDYAGTTAAGLEVLRASPAQGAINAALDASVAKAMTIAS